eukprot:scaffold34832_cov52-Phaeocystis_antarctica.AAC.1
MTTTEKRSTMRGTALVTASEKRSRCYKRLAAQISTRSKGVDFNVPPSEQLVSVPHKLRHGDPRPSSASPRMQAMSPNSPRCRAASAAPRSRGGRGRGRMSSLTAGHAISAARSLQDGAVLAALTPNPNPNP